jgi:hypothetical protein
MYSAGMPVLVAVCIVASLFVTHAILGLTTRGTAGNDMTNLCLHFDGTPFSDRFCLA